MADLLNKKAQEEIGMGIIGLGLVVVIGLMMAFFFIVLHGNVASASETPFAEREYAISTANHLSSLLAIEDDYGIKYSTLIAQKASSDFSLKHPSGMTIFDYFNNNVGPKICSWLDAGLGAGNYYFEAISRGEGVTCGIARAAEEPAYTEKQELPSHFADRFGDEIMKTEVILEVWPTSS